MKILYDHQMFSNQRFGGISNYFSQLIKNIPKENDYQLSLLLSFNEYLKEDKHFFKKIHFPLPEKQFKGRRFLKKFIYDVNQQYSKNSISYRKFDIFHPTFYDPYFLEKVKKPFVITVHDLIQFKFKDQFHWSEEERKFMEVTIKKATRIIAISQNTKKDLVEILNIDPDKIDVVHHGVNKPPQIDKPNIFGRYVLFVGQREGYKNFQFFLSAIVPVLIKDPELNVVCVGKPFSEKENEWIRTLYLKNKITAFSVSEKGLQALYSSASVFVYPSLYEGFGMPILEAFANNCPSCLSNTSSFPEIAGDAASYFDPNDPTSIRDSVERVLYNIELKEQLVYSGQKRVEKFSWKNTALQTINSYKKAIGG